MGVAGRLPSSGGGIPQFDDGKSTGPGGTSRLPVRKYLSHIEGDI
jgi:hypothetical protein